MADFQKNNQTDLLTTTEAARFLSLSPQFLERDRWAGPTIAFIRVGARAVRYRRSVLEQYLNEKEIKPAYETKNELANS